MEDISWKARTTVRHPELIQFYSFPTPNGIKVAAALEEIIRLKSMRNPTVEQEQMLLYEPHAVNIRTSENRMKWYKDLGFINGKIPGIIDPKGPENEKTVISDSGSILLYLSNKYDVLLPKDPVLKNETINWLFFGSTDVSTKFKTFGFYYKYCSHNVPYCVDRYTKEVHRLLDIMNTHLGTHCTPRESCCATSETMCCEGTKSCCARCFFVGDAYSIADISMWPWVQALFNNFDNAGERLFNMEQMYPRVFEWYTRCANRDASKRAVDVCNLNYDV